jgi:hypothetical protein
MYEKAGLGWSEVPWNQNYSKSCNEGWGGIARLFTVKPEGSEEETREVCFPAEEEALARQNGCVEITDRITGDRLPCTDGRRDGNIWCCRPGYPREYYEQSVVTVTDPQIPALPPIPEFSEPTASPASFFTKLMHPGSLLAIGLFSVAGVLLYHNWKGSR